MLRNRLHKLNAFARLQRITFAGIAKEPEPMSPLLQQKVHKSQLARNIKRTIFVKSTNKDRINARHHKTQKDITCIQRPPAGIVSYRCA